MQLGIPAFARQTAAQETLDAGDVVRVTALVIDGRSKEGLLGAVIEVAWNADRYVTDEDGRAELELPRGRYVVTVRRGGYEVVEGRLNALETSDFTLEMDRLRTMDPNATAALEVEVVDTRSGRAIQGARVSILEGGSGVTDDRGHVRFSGLRMLVARISVEMTGYAERTAPVALHQFRTAAVRVEMTVDTAAPRPITVEVRPEAMEFDHGFRENLKRGERVHVFTREILEELGLTRLSNAFRTVPGFRINRLSSGETRLEMGTNCPVAVRVDGIGKGFNIDQVPVRWVETAEVHMFGRRCAVVFIRTRK